MESKRIAAIFGIVGALIGLGYAIYNYVLSSPKKEGGNIDSLQKARDAKEAKRLERLANKELEDDENFLPKE
jgi:hypothetical protein